MLRSGCRTTRCPPRCRPTARAAGSPRRGWPTAEIETRSWPSAPGASATRRPAADPRGDAPDRSARAASPGSSSGSGDPDDCRPTSAATTARLGRASTPRRSTSGSRSSARRSLELEARPTGPCAFAGPPLRGRARRAPSTRVTYGVLNLTHRDSDEHPEPLEPGRRYRVSVRLNDVAQASRPAAIRLALSNSYWPVIWPSPEAVTVPSTLATARSLLPVGRGGSADAALPEPGPPESSGVHPTTVLRAPRTDDVTVTRDARTGRKLVRKVTWAPAGSVSPTAGRPDPSLDQEGDRPRRPDLGRGPLLRPRRVRREGHDFTIEAKQDHGLRRERFHRVGGDEGPRERSPSSSTRAGSSASPATSSDGKRHLRQSQAREASAYGWTAGAISVCEGSPSAGLPSGTERAACRPRTPGRPPPPPGRSRPARASPSRPPRPPARRYCRHRPRPAARRCRRSRRRPAARAPGRRR